jgi:hypothetical protein
MPRNDARAELAAQQRARLYPERHVIEGTVYDTRDEVYPARDVASPPGVLDTSDMAEYGWPLRNLLHRLEGKRVRITVTVLPDPPEGGDH